MAYIPESNIDRATISITMPGTGTANFRYTSTARVSKLTESCIYIDSLPPKIPVPSMVWNSFDELALIAGLERLEEETNYDFRERIKASFDLMSTSDKDNISAYVAQNVGLVGIIEWDGVTTLSLSSCELTEVTSLIVKDLPKQVLVSAEELVPSSDRKIFSSGKRAWDSGYLVYVDGMKSSTGYTIADGVIEFSSRTTSRIEATYAYTNYTLTTSGEYITEISPTLNTIETPYTIIYVRKIKMFSADEDSYRESSLLNASGEATSEFLQIARLLKTTIPITIGIVEWGGGAHWFLDEEDLPVLSSLPILLK